MKLSEFEGERALDALADLLEPVGAIMTDKDIAKLFKENRFKAIAHAIKNHKKEVISILATLDGVPVEEYKVTLVTLPIKVLNIVNDPELMALFGYQGQTGDADSSGSVSENTED